MSVMESHWEGQVRSRLYAIRDRRLQFSDLLQLVSNTLFMSLYIMIVLYKIFIHCFNFYLHTGKESGDRHPKIGNHVNLGAGSTVLGNIKVGDYAIVNAGSVVTKPVEPYTRVGGVPARYLGKLR